MVRRVVHIHERGVSRLDPVNNCLGLGVENTVFVPSVKTENGYNRTVKG